MPAASLRAIHRRLGIPADYRARFPLTPHREARRLVLVGHAPDDGKRVRLTPPAAAAWRAMRDAAALQGVILLPMSGFRSIARQSTIIRRKLAAGTPVEAILRYVAAPGFSEHHSGRAIDIGSPEHIELDAAFAKTLAYRWLRRRAGTFGFRLSYPRGSRTGIGYEPWHWCWQPPPRRRANVR